MSGGRAVRLGKSLCELRMHFCQSSAASAGLRQFVVEQYAGLKEANPLVPILVRECKGTAPRIVTRNEVGVETVLKVDGMPAGEISQVLEAHVGA